MSLAEKFKALKNTGGRRCAFGNLLSDLTEEDRTAVDNAMENKEYTAKAILNVLQSDGWNSVTIDILRRHRQHICSCYKKKEQA